MQIIKYTNTVAISPHTIQPASASTPAVKTCGWNARRKINWNLFVIAVKSVSPAFSHVHKRGFPRGGWVSPVEDHTSGGNGVSVSGYSFLLMASRVHRMGNRLQRYVGSGKVIFMLEINFYSSNFQFLISFVIFSLCYMGCLIFE